MADPIDALHNVYRGRRCFILGNGPSLSRLDLTLLRDDMLFAGNRIYRAYELGLPPIDFYFVIDKLFYRQCRSEVLAQSVGLRFFAETVINGLQLDPSEYDYVIRRFYRPKRGTRLLVDVPDFKIQPARGVLRGRSLTTDALQIAYHMGFDEYILLGCDCTYRQGLHFYDDDGIQYRKLHRGVIEAYRILDNYFKRNGRRILDATAGGALRVFPRVEYTHLFS